MDAIEQAKIELGLDLLSDCMTGLLVAKRHFTRRDHRAALRLMKEADALIFQAYGLVESTLPESA